MVGIVCWGWTAQGTLADRVRTACRVVTAVTRDDRNVSRQGLMKALKSCGTEMVNRIVDTLAESLSRIKGHWTCHGKVNIAVDGSKLKAPRSEANQEAFAPGRGTNRKRRPYRSKADASKAATVQVLMTAFWHLGTGLPIRWLLSGSSGSERTSARSMIARLPPNARLIGDAEYVGYPLWSAIMQAQRSFLFRVGSNITLLKNLGRFRLADGFVYFWPDTVLKAGEPPLLLRLIRVHNGKHTVCLVTSELDMNDETAADLYRQRWGIEVFFRTIKQSCEKSKLTCTSPRNVITELNWSLLGIWFALYLGKKSLRQHGGDISRLSPVRVMRALQTTVNAISLHGTTVPELTALLAAAVITDESHRTSSKQSRNYPRKKKRPRCGSPAINSPNTLQRKQARKLKL